MIRSKVVVAAILVALLACAGYMMINDPVNNKLVIQNEQLTVTVSYGPDADTYSGNSGFIDGRFTFSTTSRLDPTDGKSVFVIDRPVKYCGENFTQEVLLYEHITHTHELNMVQEGGFGYSDGILVKDGPEHNFDSVKISTLTVRVGMHGTISDRDVLMDVSGIEGNIDAVFREHGPGLIYEFEQEGRSTIVSAPGDIRDVRVHLHATGTGDAVGVIVMNAYVLYPNTGQPIGEMDMTPICGLHGEKSPLSFNVRLA